MLVFIEILPKSARYYLHFFFHSIDVHFLTYIVRELLDSGNIGSFILSS